MRASTSLSPAGGRYGSGEPFSWPSSTPISNTSASTVENETTTSLSRSLMISLYVPRVFSFGSLEIYYSTLLRGGGSLLAASSRFERQPGLPLGVPRSLGQLPVGEFSFVHRLLRIALRDREAPPDPERLRGHLQTRRRLLALV